MKELLQGNSKIINLSLQCSPDLEKGCDDRDW